MSQSSASLINYQTGPNSDISVQAALALAVYGPIGQCYLSLSGSNLLLARKNGQYLFINGLPQSIPQAGVTLSPSGAVANTFYYIYAHMNGSTMALEYSTTTHATDVTGIQIKSGDSTRTLVGAAYCLTAGTWTNTTNQLFVLSWFNRQPIHVSGYVPNTVVTSATGTAYTEFAPGVRIQFINWADALMEYSMYTNCYETVQVGANYSLVLNANNVSGFLGVGNALPANSYLGQFNQLTVPASQLYAGLLAEGNINYMTLTLNINANGNSVTTIGGGLDTGVGTGSWIRLVTQG
jgi:hypothetical protein